MLALIGVAVATVAAGAADGDVAAEETEAGGEIPIFPPPEAASFFFCKNSASQPALLPDGAEDNGASGPTPATGGAVKNTAMNIRYNRPAESNHIVYLLGTGAALAAAAAAPFEGTGLSQTVSPVSEL